MPEFILLGVLCFGLISGPGLAIVHEESDLLVAEVDTKKPEASPNKR